MRAIHQLVAGFANGDAISNEVRVMRGLFRSWGYESDIYSEQKRILPELRGEARDLAASRGDFREEDVVLLHLSIGSDVNDVFPGLPGRKAILYHNITPPDYFYGVQDQTAHMLALRGELPERHLTEELCCRIMASSGRPLVQDLLHAFADFGVELAGAKVCVIGRGVTVGRPIGLMLTRRSENSTVTLCHTGTKDLAAETKQADIIIAAAGKPHMLTADMVKPGAAVLDVGVSRLDGKLAGDVHPDVWEVAGAVSPNPGGVGPLTRAFLVRNVVERAERLAGL